MAGNSITHKDLTTNNNLFVPGQNIDIIKTYFNELNKDTSHFNTSNDICTPIECVKEMVDVIPQSFWDTKGAKILDCCCGNGNFHSYISTKTDIGNLYFNEINENRIKNLVGYFGKDINLTKKDFLTFDKSTLFDLVVANPPYAKFNGDKRVSKNHNLARDFINKALDVTKEGGYVLFIVPNNWMSFSDRNNLPKKLTQYRFVHIDIGGAKRYFKKVGSSFTWFLLKKTKETCPFTVSNHYRIKDAQKVKFTRAYDFIPLYLSEVSLSIVNKVVYGNDTKYKVETTSYLHRHTKKRYISDVQTKEHKYRLIHTPTQTVWSKVPHKYQKGHKVFISLSNQYSIFIDNVGMTQSMAFIRCEYLDEAERIKKELENPVYVFVNNITRYGNFNNIRVLQSLSILENIELNKKELDLIERFNSNYYGKKEK